MKRKHYRWTAIATPALILALFAIPIPTVGDTLTLDQAIETATTNNRLLKNAQLEIGKALSEVETTRIQGLPKISLLAEGSQMLAPVHFSFKQGVFGDFPVIGQVPSIDTTITSPANLSLVGNLSIMQPLTQLTRVRLGVRMKSALADITREDWRSQRNQIVSNVKQLYYGLAQIQSARNTVEESIKFLTEVERYASDNVNQGTALESDLLEVQAKLAKQRHELSSLDNTLTSTKEKLNVAMGQDVSIDYTISTVSDAAAPTLTLPELQALALKSRPEIHQAVLKSQIARDDVKFKQSESTPDVSLGLNYTRQQNIAIIPQQLITAGVVVTWQEPFDWGRRNIERSEKARTVQQADNGLEEAKSMIQVDVNMRYRELQDALSLLDTDRIEIKAKEEKRRIAANRYKESAGLLKDVLEADTDLADANRQYLSDQLAASSAQAKLDQAIGS